MSEERKLIVILEKDSQTAMQIKKYIREVNKKTDIFITGSILKANNIINAKKVSLFIADLESGGQDEIENPVIRLIAQLRECEHHLFLPVIILASSDNYRACAYKDLNCVGYFIKPVLEEKLKELVRRMLLALVKDDRENIFMIRKHNVRYFVKVKDLMYVQFFGRALHLYMSNGDLLEVDQKPLEMIIKEAKSREIMQCNRNTLVNLSYIEQMNIRKKTITLKNGLSFKMGPKFKKSIREACTSIGE